MCYSALKNGNREETMKIFSKLSEDWWAVIVAFAIILLATIGLIGKTGLNIQF